MEQENKDLLLKDICSRIPYWVRVDYMGKIYDVLGISHERLILCKPFMSQTLEYCPLVEEVKPYLFPMSSMTEDIEAEIYAETGLYDIMENDMVHIEVGANFLDVCKLFNILNKHRLDYNNLIPKGLAKDATNLNIY